MSDVLQQIGKTLTDEAIEVKVDIHAGTWLHKLMQRWKLKPAFKVFRVHQTKLGNLIRVSVVLNKIKADFPNENLLQENYNAIEKYGRDMAEVLAIVLYNKGKDAGPSSREINFILFNMPARHMLQLLNLINDRMNVQAFLASIVLMKGLNILESPAASASPARETSPMEPK